MTAWRFVAWLAGAAPDGVDLRWNAPPECPGEADVRARIARYAGDRSPETPLVVDATVERHGERWRLRLAIERADARDQRELDDVACDGLAESAAVLVAIAIAPERTDGPIPPPTTEPAPAEPMPIAEPIVEPAPVDDTPIASTPTPTRAPPPPATAKRQPVHVSLRASGGASLGWLPIGGEVSLASLLDWRFVRLEVVGTYAPRRRVRFADAPSSGADVSGWSVGARGCGVLHPARRLDLPLCGGVEAGQVIGLPVRLDDPQTGRPAWVAATLAPALRVAVHRRVGLWLSPELLVGLTRPTLRVARERDPIFASGRAGGRVHAGIELRFR